MSARDTYSGRVAVGTGGAGGGYGGGGSYSGGGGNGGGGSFDANNDLNEVQLKINRKQDESLDSTRRMVAMCEETQDVGVKTLVMLNQQGEQLERVEEGMDKINADMKDAEKNLEGLEKCCGLCVLPWRRAKAFDSSTNESWKGTEDGQVNTEGPKATAGARPSSSGQAASGPILSRITGDAREDEMEDNLQQVSSMVGNLKSMAVDMGNELETQNKALDRINYKAEKLDTRVQNANVRAQKIIRNQ